MLFLQALQVLSSASAVLAGPIGGGAYNRGGVRQVCCPIVVKHPTPATNVRLCSSSRNDPRDPRPNQWSWNCYIPGTDHVNLNPSFFPGRHAYQLAVHVNDELVNFRVRCVDKLGRELSSPAFRCTTPVHTQSDSHLHCPMFVTYGKGLGDVSYCLASPQHPIIVEYFDADTQGFECPYV